MQALKNKVHYLNVSTFEGGKKTNIQNPTVQFYTPVGEMSRTIPIKQKGDQSGVVFLKSCTPCTQCEDIVCCMAYSLYFLAMWSRQQVRPPHYEQFIMRTIIIRELLQAKQRFLVARAKVHSLTRPCRTQTHRNDKVQRVSFFFLLLTTNTLYTSKSSGLSTRRFLQMELDTMQRN